jgi:hypothetical protein
VRYVMLWVGFVQRVVTELTLFTYAEVSNQIKGNEIIGFDRIASRYLFLIFIYHNNQWV